MSCTPPWASMGPLNPFIIAEIGVNHEGSVELAKKQIELAKAGGAHAAKFQSYKAGLIAAQNSPAYWDTTKEPTKSQFELFKKYDNLEPEDYKVLSQHCDKVGIMFMSTPFDLDAVDMLNTLTPVFKVASADITNVPLLRKVARTKKPVILSTGASSLPEIQAALCVLKEAGCSAICLLHCVLNYPSKESVAQLGFINVLRRVFPECDVGYSDHVEPDGELTALLTATIMGCNVLEKHFTHDKTLPGNDHYHSMDSVDLARFLRRCEQVRTLVGGECKDLSLESAARKYARRGIYLAGDLPRGHVLTECDLICLRPIQGISAAFWDSVLGGKLMHDMHKGQPLRWSDLGESG